MATWTSVKFYSVPMQWMFPSGFLKKHKVKSVQSQLLFHQIQRSWTVFCSSWGFRNCHWFLWLVKDWLRYSRLKARLNFRKYNKLFSTTIHFYLLDPIICKQTLFFLIPLFCSRYKVIFSSSSLLLLLVFLSFQASLLTILLIPSFLCTFLSSESSPSSFCHFRWWLYFREPSQCFFGPS